VKDFSCGAPCNQVWESLFFSGPLRPKYTAPRRPTNAQRGSALGQRPVLQAIAPVAAWKANAPAHPPLFGAAAAAPRRRASAPARNERSSAKPPARLRAGPGRGSPAPLARLRRLTRARGGAKRARRALKPKWASGSFKACGSPLRGSVIFR
jgi:hypothetical protein